MSDDIKKTDDMEKETSTTPENSSKEDLKDVGEKKPDESKDSDIDQKAEEKRKQLEQLQQSVEEENEKLRKLREERRTLGNSDDTSKNDSTEDYFDEDTQQNKKEAMSIWYRMHPEYSPENDYNNLKFNELNKHFKRLNSGSSVSEILETIDYAHTHFMQKDGQKDTKEDIVEDSGIGDTVSKPQDVDKPSILTRKLNKYELEAARVFPGGEQAYRQERAKTESK